MQPAETLPRRSDSPAPHDRRVPPHQRTVQGQVRSRLRLMSMPSSYLIIPDHITSYYIISPLPSLSPHGRAVIALNAPSYLSIPIIFSSSRPLSLSIYRTVHTFDRLTNKQINDTRFLFAILSLSVWRKSAVICCAKVTRGDGVKRKPL